MPESDRPREYDDMTDPAKAAEAATKFGRWWAALNPQQIIQVLFAVLITFILGLTIWLWISTTKERQDQAAFIQRANEAQLERIQLWTSVEREKDRIAWKADRDEDRRDRKIELDTLYNRNKTDLSALHERCDRAEERWQKFLTDHAAKWERIILAGKKGGWLGDQP